MPVTLTIKNVPDALADKLRAAASRNHRSLQGELMVMLEAVGKLHDLGPSQTKAQPSVAPTSLADELSGLVAGSRFGAEPWLTREQANDRPLRIHQKPT